MMAQASLDLPPGRAGVVALEISVARRRIEASRRGGVRREGMRIVWTACHPVAPGAAAVIAPHEGARLDTREDPTRLVRVGLEPANVVRVGTRRKAPRRRRG